MTTITSSSNHAGLTAMLRHDLRRTRLMSALFFLLEFIALPLQLALKLINRPEHGFALRASTYGQVYGNFSAVLFPLVILLAAAVLAMQLMNYNFGRRSVDVYYSLPFTRRQMILSHLIAGTLDLAVPILLNLSIAAGLALAINPALGLGWLIKDALLWVLLAYCIFISVMLTATLMGTAVDTMLYAGMLNLEPFLILIALLGILGTFVIGFDPTTLMDRLLPYFHPLPLLIRQIFTDTLVPMSVWGVGFWAVLIPAATLLTVFFYERRDAELAENVSRDNWFRLIFKITSAFLLAVVFGFMIFAAVASDNTCFNTTDQLAFVLGCAGGAVIGYLVLEVVLGRGFKTVRSNWWICLADLVATVGIALVAVTGLFGYESAVPVPASVNYALVEGYLNHYWRDFPGLHTTDSVRLSKEESIAALTLLHQSAIDAAHRQSENGDQEDGADARLRVVYHLQNGCTVTRSYYGLELNEVEAEQFRSLYSTAEVMEQVNPLLKIGENETQLDGITVMDVTGSELRVSDSQTERLMEAVRQDLFETAGSATEQQGEPLIFLNIGYRYPMLEYYYDELSGEGIERPAGENSNTLQYPIYEDFFETLELLQELGIGVKDFDPADYTAVYGVHDHYDLYYDTSTFRISPAMAYYWVSSDQPLFGESEVIEDIEIGDTATAQSASSSMLAAGSFTQEEIQMLYDLSRPYGENSDREMAILFDTGRTQQSGRSHLMLVRFIPEDTLISLDPELLKRMALSVRTDENGERYISQDNALYLDSWPQATLD